MKSKSIIKFTLAVLVIAILAYIAACGLTIGNFSIPKALDAENGIKRGLDLAGGSVIVFEADTTEAVSDDDMASVREVLRNRLDTLGYFEAVVSQQGSNRVRVEIPSVTDPEEAVQILGATAKLTFRDAENNIVMVGGEDVKSAKAAYDQIDDAGNKGYLVHLTLTSQGQKKFAESTAVISSRTDGKNYLAIYLDENPISAPMVKETINSETCVISGDFTQEDAKTLAAQIQSGQLPFSLKEIELRSVGPQLGEKALENSLLAGAIGLLIVALFMIVMYRMCGVIADIALVFYVSLVAIILSYFRINLTLPGIAGVILTIGTAVDANVIIFERIKEELGVGKTIRASVEAGFNRAFTAIVDSNITTLIAAAVLYYFGTGTIKGFAVTLFIGTIVSMFTAVFVTKFMLRQMIGFNMKNPKLYSAVKGGKQNV